MPINQTTNLSDIAGLEGDHQYDGGTFEAFSARFLAIKGTRVTFTEFVHDLTASKRADEDFDRIGVHVNSEAKMSTEHYTVDNGASRDFLTLDLGDDTVVYLSHQQGFDLLSKLQATLFDLSLSQTDGGFL